MDKGSHMDQDSTLRKIFKASGCLDRAALLAYADGQLEGAELHQVEHHLNDCEICDLALEAVLETGTERFSKMLNESDSRIAARLRQGGRKPATRKFGWRGALSAAAGIILLAVVGWYFFLSSPEYADIAGNWVDKTYHSGVTRQGDAVSDYEKGLQLLDDQAYEAAISQLEAAKSGLDETKLKDYEWFRALAYLGAGKIDEARAQAAKVAADSGNDFQEAATELLKEIEGL